MPFKYLLTAMWQWIATTGINLGILLCVALMIPRVGRLIVRWVTIHMERSDEAKGEYADPETRKGRLAILGALVYIGEAIAFFFVVIHVLKAFGFSTSTAAVPATVASAAVAFGAQKIIADFLAGFFIISERQFGVGDWVVFNTSGGVIEGEVTSITLRATTVRTTAGQEATVPNSVPSVCINASSGWARAVIDMPIPISAASNTEELNELFDSCVSSTLERPEIAALVSKDDDAVKIQPATQVISPTSAGVPWCLNYRVIIRVEPGQQWLVERAVRAAVMNRMWASYSDSTMESFGPDLSSIPGLAFAGADGVGDGLGAPGPVVRGSAGAGDGRGGRGARDNHAAAESGDGREAAGAVDGKHHSPAPAAKVSYTATTSIVGDAAAFEETLAGEEAKETEAAEAAEATADAAEAAKATADAAEAAADAERAEVAATATGATGTGDAATADRHRTATPGHSTDDLEDGRIVAVVDGATSDHAQATVAHGGEETTFNHGATQQLASIDDVPTTVMPMVSNAVDQDVHDVTGAAEPQAETTTEAGTKAEAGTETKTKTKAETEAGAKAEAGSETETKAGPETNTNEAPTSEGNSAARSERGVEPSDKVSTLFRNDHYERPIQQLLSVGGRCRPSTSAILLTLIVLLVLRALTLDAGEAGAGILAPSSSRSSSTETTTTVESVPTESAEAATTTEPSPTPTAANKTGTNNHNGAAASSTTVSSGSSGNSGNSGSNSGSNGSSNSGSDSNQSGAANSQAAEPTSDAAKASAANKSATANEASGSTTH